MMHFEKPKLAAQNLQASSGFLGPRRAQKLDCVLQIVRVERGLALLRDVESPVAEARDTFKVLRACRFERLLRL